MLLVAATLIVLIGIAHSYLGERFILIRLFRQPLPKLFGSDDFTKKTLRFAWHITTIAWFGFAALVLQVHGGTLTPSSALSVTGVVFGVSAVVALVASKGKHYSWIVFSAIAAVCFVWMGT